MTLFIRIAQIKKDDWLDYVKQDVLCTAFSYARYCEILSERTVFSVKDCLSLPGLGWKYFNSLRSEEDEPINTHNDKHMRWSVRQSFFGGRVCTFNQYYKSKKCEKFLKLISEELNLKGKVYDIIEAYIKYKKDHSKSFEGGYENEFDDYRKRDQEVMQEHIIKRLSEFLVHKLLQELSLNNLLRDFDAVNLYPSTMSDPESIIPKTETGYAYMKDINDELVKKFNYQTSTQISTILKVKFYNPKNLIVQHLPVKEREKKMEINRMRNGYNIQTLTSVDIQEYVKIGVKLIKIFESVIYRENFKVPPFKKVGDKKFELRQKNKLENNVVMQLLIKLIMNSLYEENKFETY